ncbi:MAG TPA: [protein-PII] uridylyltransferase [Candidatus Binatia bacterium]|nr:[protein-PII] uridylyltransferase [Candidatus Binatia bacterium]
MILATTPAFEPLRCISALPDVRQNVSLAGATARGFVQAARDELWQRHDGGAGGLGVVAAYTHAIDRLVGWLFDNATSHYQAKNPRLNQRCTLVAQGGYGRGELNIQSDIDLLFLYPWKVNPYAETIAEIVIPGLYDAGLVVGAAMRNVRECCRLAARDLKVKTALLDARYLCGDRSPYDDFEHRVVEEVWAPNRQAFFKEKLKESEERHARHGDSIYLLQPQLKEGLGGLRDLHTALWMAKVRFKVSSFRDLVALGVLTDRDIGDMDAALDFLWRVRNAMHFATGSHQDHLTFDLQDRLAVQLGFGQGRAGVEAFMRRYYTDATTVHRLGETVIARCVQVTEAVRYTAPPIRTIREGMRIQGTVLSVTGREVFEEEPATMVEVFSEAQRHGASLSVGTSELLRNNLDLLAAARDTPAVAASFLRVLRGRGHIAESLLEMHKLGVLKTLFPEFGRIEWLIAHDPFHIYTVDHHSLAGVRELELLREGKFADSVPQLTDVMRELPQPELLMLGMIFHDVGKGHGHDHSGRGADMMGEIADRLCLNEDARAACVFLVQHHLLLSHLAQQRDISDDQLVADFCRTVGSVENLQRLYVLTYADMRAVAPGIWNNWRGTLVTELYRRAFEFFEKGVFEPEDRAARAERIRARVRAAAPPAQHDGIETFVEQMRDSYFLSTPEEVMLGHGELRRRFEQAEAGGEQPAVATQLITFPERDFTEFAVCTRDRPGLFARLSGVLAAHGMNILAARIDTSRDDVALDAFRVSHEAGDDAVDRDRWERVERTLREVLSGARDVEALVAGSSRPSVLTKQRRPVPTRVEFHNDVSAAYTVVDVYAADRVGLLFTITNCLYHLWVQIHLAKITTMVNEVLDVFYVTDAEGRKLEDPGHLARIREELVRALSPAPAPAASEPVRVASTA